MMRNERASRTAETIAIHRAAESMRPERQRVCNDPLAAHFVSPDVIKRFKSPIRRTIARCFMNYFYPGVNGAVVARVRFIDDKLNTCIQNGLEQLVIIGAGYDTRPYRLNFPDNGFRVFEVDQATTQKVKIGKLKTILSEIPDYVSFVPVDLEKEELEAKLLAAGYDENRKSLFILEGLVMYLQRETFEKLLTFVAHLSGKGSAVVFDYLPESMVDGSVRAREGRSMYRFVIRNGEPFRFGMDAAQMERLLTEKGFVRISNRPATDYRGAYFGDENQGRKISEIFSFMYASIKAE